VAGVVEVLVERRGENRMAHCGTRAEQRIVGQDATNPDAPARRDDLETDVVILAAVWQGRRDQIASWLDSRSGWTLADTNDRFVTVRFDRPADARALREVLR
jgi:hypothetical protein